MGLTLTLWLELNWALAPIRYPVWAVHTLDGDNEPVALDPDAGSSIIDSIVEGVVDGVVEGVVDGVGSIFGSIFD